MTAIEVTITNVSNNSLPFQPTHATVTNKRFPMTGKITQKTGYDWENDCWFRKTTAELDFKEGFEPLTVHKILLQNKALLTSVEEIRAKITLSINDTLVTFQATGDFWGEYVHLGNAILDVHNAILNSFHFKNVTHGCAK